MKIGHWILPPKLKPFWKRRRRTRFNLLDVGCGNHSPSLTKYWYPGAQYHGLDREVYNNAAADLKHIDRFFCLDLCASSLEELPDRFFDVIIMAHVVEHLPNGLEVIAKLSAKLAPGGDFYIEFPSPRSLLLPPGLNSLHFCDDSTHTRVYDAREIANLLLANGCSVVRGGRRRSWPWLCVEVALLPTQLYYILRNGKLRGDWLWNLLGFADFVHAVRPQAYGAPRAEAVVRRAGAPTEILP